MREREGRRGGGWWVDGFWSHTCIKARFPHDRDQLLDQVLSCPKLAYGEMEQH